MAHDSSTFVILYKMNRLLLLCCFALCHAQNKNIIRLAEELGATTLVGYVRAAGLEGTLNGDGKICFVLFFLVWFKAFFFIIFPVICALWLK